MRIGMIGLGRIGANMVRRLLKGGHECGGTCTDGYLDCGPPVPVLSAALYGRFTSRGDALFQDKVISAMRFQFGGHVEKSAAGH